LICLACNQDCISLHENLVHGQLAHVRAQVATRHHTAQRAGSQLEIVLVCMPIAESDKIIKRLRRLLAQRKWLMKKADKYRCPELGQTSDQSKRINSSCLFLCAHHVGKQRSDRFQNKHNPNHRKIRNKF
jgi:hypothetical protein